MADPLNTIEGDFDIDECNRRNHNAMLNTATGRWLAAACREIESLRLERDCLAKKAKLCDQLRDMSADNGFEALAKFIEIRNQAIEASR